jgi:hypothetical protein
MQLSRAFESLENFLKFYVFALQDKLFVFLKVLFPFCFWKHCPLFTNYLKGSKPYSFIQKLVQFKELILEINCLQKARNFKHFQIFRNFQDLKEYFKNFKYGKKFVEF